MELNQLIYPAMTKTLLTNSFLSLLTQGKLTTLSCQSADSNACEYRLRVRVIDRICLFSFKKSVVFLAHGTSSTEKQLPHKNIQVTICTVTSNWMSQFQFVLVSFPHWNMGKVFILYPLLRRWAWLVLHWPSAWPERESGHTWQREDYREDTMVSSQGGRQAIHCRDYTTAPRSFSTNKFPFNETHIICSRTKNNIQTAKLKYKKENKGSLDRTSCDALTRWSWEWRRAVPETPSTADRAKSPSTFLAMSLLSCWR